MICNRLKGTRRNCTSDRPAVVEGRHRMNCICNAMMNSLMVSNRNWHQNGCQRQSVADIEKRRRHGRIIEFHEIPPPRRRAESATKPH
ncbi:unnamed protein product [Linum trigynum]|uniref:Uncharacterized protein n=1 Tax=Linum trigynum TaxID=586398 RepID=A0AAV2F9Y0_9ROSI